MPLPLLPDLCIIFALGLAILLVCHRLRLPSILGFLLTGMMAGPHGLGWISEVHQVEMLAEIGVVLLLFTIGIEFSLAGLLRMKKAVLVGGTLQLLLTVGVCWGLGLAAGQPVNDAAFMAFLLTLSSTAIVLKLLQERGEIDAPHGRTVLAILIFQDLMVAPLMLLTPLLAGRSANLLLDVPLMVLKSAAVIGLVYLAARLLMPRLLLSVARTRSRETFIITIAAIALGVALLTSSIGLSYALGAFLAGLVISESEYSHHALGNILPFRDLFTSLFFISIGMLFDTNFLWAHAGIILLLAGGVLLLKALLAAVAVWPLGYPPRTWLLSGLALGQVGEFSFVLSRVGLQYGLLGESAYQYFLDVSILTMAVTPLVMALGPRLIGRLLRRQEVTEGTDPCLLTELHNHVVVVGYGINGRNVARALKAAGIPYAIIEINPDTVLREREQGEPIFFGDVTQREVLEQVAFHCARAVVLGISDPAAARQAVALLREANPSIYLIVRTKYMVEVESLIRLGADEVVAEEFESSVEVFTRLLERYLVPRSDIDRHVADIRADGYRMFRSPNRTGGGWEGLQEQLPQLEVGSLRVEETDRLAGRSLAELQLRRRFGVTVLAVRRGRRVIANPEASSRLQPEDVLVLLGLPQQVSQLALAMCGKIAEDGSSA